ncbi:MAG TPA: hypothetical protein VF615_16870 [Longimicrobiaceae bacterium]|jgi:hypothetical protein
MSTSYPPPVAGLLELGEEAVTNEWLDYPALGLGPEHVPELIRMATDPALHDADEESPALWAPTHAWRALGQLRAAEAVEPLLELAVSLGDELFTDPELAVVFGVIGAAAIPPLARILADDSESHARHVLAANGLDEIAARDPSSRGEVVPLLMARLEKWDRNSEIVNAYLVDALTEMRVMEAAPLMEQAFAAGRVDVLMRGDWEDVQADLGLIEKRRGRGGGLRGSFQAMREAAFEDYLAPLPAPGPASRPGAPGAKAKKNKRKQQKESRKRNRRRK